MSKRLLPLALLGFALGHSVARAAPSLETVVEGPGGDGPDDSAGPTDVPKSNDA